ncbi:MAG TPA: hypothetical protein VGC53_00140 [Vicinamibacteria bacterium]|jgi:hypothetical protein
MRYANAVVAGVVGGAIGAAVWAAVGYYTGYEVGWIAWGIGGLVGVAVRLVSNPGTDPMTGQTLPENPRVPGVIAAVIAIAAVVAGKYAVIHVTLPEAMNEELNDEVLISYLADDVAYERSEAGEPVDWPEGVDPDYAYQESDYPTEVWREATERWNGMSQSERESMRGLILASYDENLSGMGTQALLSSFNLFDLLWFALAGWTAFKIGSSGAEA